MRKLIVFLAVLSLVFGSQQVDAQTSSSSEASKLLHTVSSKVHAYDNIVIQFEYDMRDLAANTHQKTRGKVYLEGDKYRLDLMGITRLFDGKKLYTISREDEEVTISNYNPDSDTNFSLSKMLLFYENGYDYKMDIVQNVHGRRIQYIKLTPQDQSSDVKQILLGIDKRTKHIYKLIQEQKGGGQITVKMNSFKTNQPLSKTLFVFQEKDYPDYYINRLD